MSATISGAEDGQVIVECVSRDSLTKMLLGLNFREERLQIDTINGLISVDDGSEAAARSAAHIAQFDLDYLLNGVLEVWNADRNEMLGRCDAFVPTNIDVRGTAQNYRNRIHRLKAEADVRALRSAARPSSPADQEAREKSRDLTDESAPSL